MFTIFFWIITIIIAVLSGIYIFLIVNSIRTKAHNHPESSRVVIAIVIASLIGFMVFGWNTFTLFNSLNNFAALNGPTLKKDNTNTNSSSQESKANTNANDGSGYQNF